MDISEKVDLVQARVRAATRLDERERKSGMTDMFTSETIEFADETRSSPAEVDAFWLRYLASGERRVDTAAFADILEETNWLPGELQASLVRLIGSGHLVNLDAGDKKRPAKPLHFDRSGERLRLTDSGLQAAT